MRIAFVGLEKDYSTIDPSYVRFFNKYHLEIPWYYAECGGNDVYVTTVRETSRENEVEVFPSGGSFKNISEVRHQICSTSMADGGKPTVDVVVHWRKWREDLYVPGALNLLHTCDHSYPQEWKQKVKDAYDSGKLYGILCYRSWHQRNMQVESGLPLERLFTDCTLGVDTDIYKPAQNKDPFQMLWSSDPGRGLQGAIELALRLYAADKRFRLHVCYPDYVRAPNKINHPALVWRGNVSNGPELWNLFNETGILPYTSTFMEPSSRAHRQAQAAGSLVLYPPNMGSPSELIVDDVTGVVAPVGSWPARILDLVRSGKWADVGTRARDFAVEQNWASQAQNFNALIQKIGHGR